jgi:dTDP-glucose pyrophosphorylase
MQPLAFSKELLPVGDRDGERPKAVSEYLVDRLIRGGADKICFVISPGKTDIIQYYGNRVDSADIAYVVQPTACGLCDALFRAHVLVHHDESVLVGLPDTIWFPTNALQTLPDDRLAFLTFPVSRPELFDAVVSDVSGRVLNIQVKSENPSSSRIWGAFRMPGRIFHELRGFWRQRDERDEYLGTLVNAWLDQGGDAVAIHTGETYVDVGTLHGYREAIHLLSTRPAAAAPLQVTRSIRYRGE